MKKALVFALCVGLVTVESWAVCSPGSGRESADEYLNISKNGTHYECDDDVCGHGYRLSVLDGSWIGGGGGSYSGAGRYRCRTDIDSGWFGVYEDAWVTDGEISNCAEVPASLRGDYIRTKDNNAKPTFYDYNKQQIISNNVVGNNTNLCVLYMCKKMLGYAPNEDGTKCTKACRDTKGGLTEPGTDKDGMVSCHNETLDKLSDTANVKDGDYCKLSCTYDGAWVLKVTDKACANGYVPNKNADGCVKSDATKRKEAAVAEQKRKDAAEKRQEELDANQRKCQESFGEWKNDACFCDSSKNLTKNTKFDCKCVDESIYQKNPETKQCELTGAEKRRILCNSDAAVKSGAFWDGTNCNCLPDGRNRPRGFDGEQGKCVLSEDIVKCDSVSGAQWKVATNSCVCLTTNYVPDYEHGKCVEDPKIVAERKSAELKKKISSAHSVIHKLSDAKKTVWRYEEGKFNTARLASDSIAGVVLGTTGALVTSHLVKKKHVEDGFEDLECTIGGQTVAGWGDEFTIGIGE